MEEIDIIKAVTVLIAFATTIFALFKILIDVKHKNSAKNKGDYEFSKEFIENLERGDKHPFIKERGFQGLTGENYSVPEIKYLFSFPHPTEAIYLRKTAADFIKFNPQDTTYEIDGLNKKYENKPNRRYIFGYIFFATIATLPIILRSINFEISNLATIMYFFSGGVIATYSMNKHLNLESAQEFLKMQSEHTNPQ